MTQPPPRPEVPPQPSASGWIPSGPPSPRSRGSRSSSESEASDTESDFAAHDSSSARLAELIYEVCPNSRPLLDDFRHPHCEFESWFSQPEYAASRPRFRLYPCVAEVESEVTARAVALACRSKPLSQILPSRYSAMRLQTCRCMRPLLLLTRPFLSWQGLRLWGRGVGVPSLFQRWRSLSVYSGVSWR